VNRTHAILLGLGIGACLLLSMMMKQALTVHREQGMSPLMNRITAVYGAQLTRVNKLEVHGDKNQREATLVVTPAPDVEPERLATRLGELLWREIGASEGLARVRVLCSDAASGKVRERIVPRPAFVKGLVPAPGK
jgi:hypothetical protein